MFGLILFSVVCIAFLLWLLLNPSGQAFARNVEILRKAKEAEQQKRMDNSAASIKLPRQNKSQKSALSKSKSSAKTFRETMKNINWILGFFTQEAIDKSNRRIRRNMSGNSAIRGSSRRKRR
jgi:hypothetical protein